MKYTTDVQSNADRIVDAMREEAAEGRLSVGRSTLTTKTGFNLQEIAEVMEFLQLETPGRVRRQTKGGFGMFELVS
ncbi:MAG: hypothetical protein EXR58_06145 [Chloroflexi bacterium]|nr:hypothetical protein [Chloroflexota bacterium]